MSTEKISEFSDRHRRARRLAASGIPVIPCGDDKRPVAHLAPRGIDSESADVATIDRWWSEGDWNYGYRPWHMGCAVVDADLYKGIADADLAGLPATRTVTTPSGGRHLYYRVAGPLGNRGLAKNIDVRCANGYVLGPGSVIDGKAYILSDARAVEPLPPAILAQLTLAPAAPVAAPDGLIAVDDDERLIEGCERIAAAYVAKHGVGTEPRGDRAYGLANLLADQRNGNHILSWETISEILAAHGFHEVPDDVITRRKAGDRGWRELEDPVEAPPVSDRPIPAAWQAEPDRHSAEWWLRRELPPRVKLIGPLNTAARAMLFAGTGIGKTHFAMAIACAAAGGGSIFSGGFWAAPEPRRVLYVDGEMPLALLQDRLREALGRAGDTGGRLSLLSTADFPDADALNTPSGQEWINTYLAAIDPELVIFDNIQSLVAGDMKEADGWRSLQTWMRSLTDHGIAQLWVHHANADGTMYGDKTRTWQMDTVLSMQRVEGETGVCFDLSYDSKFGGKARERHPGRNGSEYREGRVTLQGNIWRFQDAAAVETADIESVLAGAGRRMKTGELAGLLGMSRQAVEKKAKKWSRFVIPGSAPLEWGLPVVVNDSRLA